MVGDTYAKVAYSTTILKATPIMLTLPMILPMAGGDDR